MTSNAQLLLDALLAQRPTERSEAGEALLPDDEAFELFAIEQCLKQQDLSEDEVVRGRVGGGDDGGLDDGSEFVSRLYSKCGRFSGE